MSPWGGLHSHTATVQNIVDKFAIEIKQGEHLTWFALLFNGRCRNYWSIGFIKRVQVQIPDCSLNALMTGGHEGESSNLSAPTMMRDCKYLI